LCRPCGDRAPGSVVYTTLARLVEIVPGHFQGSG
jgi:hypothetical protein